MRGVVLGLALFVAATTSACAMSLQRHAQVASIAADVLTAAAQDIDAERLADVKQFRAETPADESPFVTERRLAVLEASFNPVMQAFDEAKSALLVYETALSKAIAAGQDSLATAPAIALLNAWKKAAELGDAVGVKLPAPAAELVKLAGGSP